MACWPDGTAERQVGLYRPYITPLRASEFTTQETRLEAWQLTSVGRHCQQPPDV